MASFLLPFTVNVRVEVLQNGEWLNSAERTAHIDIYRQLA